jgi:hypothetical protein
VDCCSTVQNTIIIPSPKPSRRPANIPLRSLSTTAARGHPPSAAGAAAVARFSTHPEKQGRRSSRSRSPSPSSEGSWRDTGDLAEQLGDPESPLQTRDTTHAAASASARRAPWPKRVQYSDDGEEEEEDVERKGGRPGLVKEDIEIPKPAPRRIPRVEHLIAAAMSGGERQMHGLTGKALV